MRIGGLVKQSLVDWPGYLAAVIFTKGCNFRCSYCHNPLLVLPELMNKTPDLPEHSVIDYLKQRKEWLDGVVITGGEPTMQADLIRFICEIREIGLRIKLDTNGSDPELLNTIIERRLVDFIAMDIKSELNGEKYEIITGISDKGIIENILRSIKIIHDSGVSHQFRTTMLPGIHSHQEIDSIRSLLKGSDHVIQNFREGVIVESFSLMNILPENEFQNT